MNQEKEVTMRVAVTGAAGRMGRQLIQAVHECPDMELGAAAVSPDSLLVGGDAGELAGTGSLGVRIISDIAVEIDRFSVLIDFSNPVHTL